MKFAEKLDRLTANLNKSKLAKEAGLPSTAISNYLNKGQTPRIDTAVALARVLNVSLAWLADDSQSWPPPATSTTATLSTAELAAELGRRMMPTAVTLLGLIERANRVNWAKTARELLAADPMKPLAKRLLAVAELPSQMNALARELDHYDPNGTIGDPVPPGLEVLPGFWVSLLTLAIWKRNVEVSPGFKATAKLGTLWLIPDEYRPEWFADVIAHAREVATAELAEIERAVASEPAAPSTAARTLVDPPSKAGRKPKPAADTGPVGRSVGI